MLRVYPENSRIVCKTNPLHYLYYHIYRIYKRQVKELSDKISRYIAGEFDYEGGSLVFSCSKIELNLTQDEILEDSFTIKEQSGKQVQARIYSSNLIMKCDREEYSGEEITVSYKADTTGKISGDVIKGEFQIVSDMGEYVIPYVISIRHETIDSSLGNIKNLFHFTNLAKSDWTEAVKIFIKRILFLYLTVMTVNIGVCIKGCVLRGIKTATWMNF